jgi:hypothetical protein
MNQKDICLIYDKPIPYKNLLIYPAKMKDYIDFHIYVGCLLYDKNSIPSIEIITMSYLKYILYIAKTDKSPSLYLCDKLLHMILMLEEDNKIEYYIKDDGNAYFLINGEEYNSSDFDYIKKIICEQNEIHLIDETIQKEVRDAMEKAQEYRMMQNKNKMCSLEDQMICVLISSNLKLEDIYNLTIRKFSKILQRIDYKMHYEIYLSASMSGFVKFKDEDSLKHWMCDLTEEDKYATAKIDEEAVQQKIDGVNNPGKK